MNPPQKAKPTASLAATVGLTKLQIDLTPAILAQGQKTPTTKQKFFCHYHPDVKAEVIVAAQNLSSSEKDFRPVCGTCFELVRNSFTALGEGRAA